MVNPVKKYILINDTYKLQYENGETLSLEKGLHPLSGEIEQLIEAEKVIYVKHKEDAPKAALANVHEDCVYCMDEDEFISHYKEKLDDDWNTKNLNANEILDSPMFSHYSHEEDTYAFFDDKRRTELSPAIIYVDELGMKYVVRLESD